MTSVSILDQLDFIRDKVINLEAQINKGTQYIEKMHLYESGESNLPSMHYKVMQKLLVIRKVLEGHPDYEALPQEFFKELRDAYTS